METFLEVFGSFAKDHLYIHVILIFMATFLLIAAMGVDLVSGVKKAIKNGEATTSTGFKKTCDKARKYFAPFIVLVCIDLICSVVVPFPIFSLAWAAFCIFCEFKSVREKSWDKAALRKAEKTMNIVVENKDDIARMVVELLTSQERKRKE